MNTRMLVLTLLVLMLAMPVALYAQESDLAAVIADLEKAMNAGDVDAALALLTDDAVFTSRMLGEESVYTGAAEVRVLFEELVAGDFQMQIEILQVEGGTVSRYAAWRRPAGGERNLRLSGRQDQEYYLGCH